MCLQRTKPITGDITTNLERRKNSDYYFIFPLYGRREHRFRGNIFNEIKMSVMED